MIARRADRHRGQLVILCDHRKHLNARLTRICQTLDETRLPGGLKWMIDVDPQETG
jgi:primosomal protein N' (replication factor Y)